MVAFDSRARASTWSSVASARVVAAVADHDEHLSGARAVAPDGRARPSARRTGPCGRRAASTPTAASSAAEIARRAETGARRSRLRTSSLKRMANSSSCGLLERANASDAATTSPIFGRMLPLASMTRPTVTGVSSLVKSSIGTRAAVVEDGELFAREIRDVAALLVGDDDGKHDQLARCAAGSSGSWADATSDAAGRAGRRAGTSDGRRTDGRASTVLPRPARLVHRRLTVRRSLLSALRTRTRRRVRRPARGR